jgi:hypothetical protein
MGDANYVPAAFRRAAFSLHPSAKRRQPAQLQKEPSLCGLRDLAPAFSREATSRNTQTPPFALSYLLLGSLTANAFFTLGQISRLKIIDTPRSRIRFEGAHAETEVSMVMFSYASPLTAAQPD